MLFLKRYFWEFLRQSPYPGVAAPAWLRQLIECEGEFALLVRSVVLVEDSLRNGLVDLLDGSLICGGSFFLVAGCEGSVVLLHDGTHLVLEHLVLELPAVDGAEFHLVLPYVGESARVWLNGIDLGLRVNPPYRYLLNPALRDGKNELVIEVQNTLANAVCDHFSTYMAIRPAGILGKPYIAWDDTLAKAWGMMNLLDMLPFDLDD